MDQNRPTVLRAILVTVGLVVLLAWAMVAIAVDDALWFLPVFVADASQIDLYWDGDHVTLLPGSSAYELLNDAVRQEFPRPLAHPSGSGLSQVSLDRLRAEGRLAEVSYDRPVRIHTTFGYGPSQVYYIPLAGHHAGLNRVFNQGRGVPLELHSTAAIRSAAETVARDQGLGQP